MDGSAPGAARGEGSRAGSTTCRTATAATGLRAASPTATRSRARARAARAGDRRAAAEARPARAGVAPDAELDALKAILLREGYLRRVEHMCKGNRGRSARSRGLLDLLRSRASDGRGDRGSWRRVCVGGINYLLKMPSDLDFVDVACPPCRAWLRFGEPHPFVVPMPMEAGRAARASGRMAPPSSGYDRRHRRQARRVSPRPSADASNAAFEAEGHAFETSA